MDFFRVIWDSRAVDGWNEDFETGKPLSTYYRDNPACFHHLLTKQKYPELAFVPENIVILHPDTHAQVHTDISKTPKIQAETQQILDKYINNQLECVKKNK